MPTHPHLAQESFTRELARRHAECAVLPTMPVVEAWIDGLLSFLFPERSVDRAANESAVQERLVELETRLAALLGRIGEGASHADMFVRALPHITRMVGLDARAILEEDPAAHSLGEVLACYPGLVAVAHYRVAHAMHGLGVLLLPRMLTEIAHAKTGIDIHPGASIGESFCIDHGTGVVIGETTTIGNHVKLYQGVTLGALSVRKDLATSKRHPTIEDHVVVYAQAAILGGKTVIGHHSTIGGNVWLTHSVPAHSLVLQPATPTVSSRREHRPGADPNADLGELGFGANI